MWLLNRIVFEPGQSREGIEELQGSVLVYRFIKNDWHSTKSEEFANKSHIAVLMRESQRPESGFIMFTDYER